MSVLVVGAGPGIGAAVAERFGREGLAIGLIARTPGRLESLAASLRGEGITAATEPADIRRPDELVAAIDALTEALGPVDVLCFSPLARVELIKPVLETTVADFADALALGMTGAAAAVNAVVPGMRQRGQGSLLFTTGSAAIAPSAARAVSGVVYAAELAYVQMLGEALAEDGVAVVTTTMVGPVGPRARHEPATVAEHLWRQHAAGATVHEVLR